VPQEDALVAIIPLSKVGSGTFQRTTMVGFREVVSERWAIMFDRCKLSLAQALLL
jgi:hypothetical protein